MEQEEKEGKNKTCTTGSTKKQTASRNTCTEHTQEQNMNLQRPSEGGRHSYPKALGETRDTVMTLIHQQRQTAGQRGRQTTVTRLLLIPNMFTPIVSTFPHLPSVTKIFFEAMAQILHKHLSLLRIYYGFFYFFIFSNSFSLPFWFPGNCSSAVNSFERVKLCLFSIFLLQILVI